MNFVYTLNDGKSYRDHNGVRIIASAHLTTIHHDDDQSPQQEQINRAKCCHCAEKAEHTQQAHEDECTSDNQKH